MAVATQNRTRQETMIQTIGISADIEGGENVSNLRDFSNPAASWVEFNLFHDTAVQGLRAALES